MSGKLFGTSGIRGVVNKEITPFLALDLGSSLATRARGGRIAVGMDTRVSSPMLENALVSGMIAGGCSVIELGVVPTPVLAYLTRSLRCDAGVMITASHNPPEYNGMKLFASNSMAYTDEEQTEIASLIQGQNFVQRDWDKLGSTVLREETDRYVDDMTNETSFSKRWKVVLDPGCGATYDVAARVFKAVGCEVKTINAQPDGNFPGRSPEPSPENLADLCAVVKETGSDIGFAYDGDGDRFTVVGEKGEVFPLDKALAVYAGFAVKGSSGGLVVTTVEASMVVDEAVRRAGGKVMRTAVGDVNVADSLVRYKAVFGGEPCGAWIHPKYHLCPDGVLSSLLFLKAVYKSGVSASEFLGEVQSYPVIRSKFNCLNEKKEKVIRKVVG